MKNNAFDLSDDGSYNRSSESLMMVTILKAQRQPRYDFTSCDDDDDAHDHTDDFDHDGSTSHWLVGYLQKIILFTLSDA